MQLAHNGDTWSQYTALSFTHETGARIVGVSLGGLYRPGPALAFAAEARLGVRIHVTDKVRIVVAVNAIVPVSDPPVPIVAFTAGLDLP